MKRLLWLVLLSGCTHVRSFQGPDGGTMYEARCNGGMQTFADCMNAAGETCGGAYDVVTNDREQEFHATGGTAYAPGSAHTSTKRTVMFRCRSERTETAE